MKKALTLLLLCLLAANAGAAEKIRPEVFRMATDSVSRMYSRKTTVQNRLTLKKVEKTGDRLDLFFDHSLSDFPWREKDVEWFRTQFKRLLPSDYASCEIGKVFAKETEIEDLVTPPLGLKGWPQPYGHVSEDRNLRRLFVEREGSVRYPKGMSGRNIALWQSHGRYFDEGSGQWKWQPHAGAGRRLCPDAPGAGYPEIRGHRRQRPVLHRRARPSDAPDRHLP